MQRKGLLYVQQRSTVATNPMQRSRIIKMQIWPEWIKRNCRPIRSNHMLLWPMCLVKTGEKKSRLNTVFVLAKDLIGQIMRLGKQADIEIKLGLLKGRKGLSWYCFRE